MHLLRWSLILLLVLIAATGGTLLIGRTQPDQNPLRALGFDVCEGKPCFRGIVPGVTTMAEATEILQDSIDFVGTGLGAQIGQFGLGVYPVNPDCRNKVCDPSEPVMFDFRDYKGTERFLLGDAMAIYGSPCGVMSLTDMGGDIVGFELQYSYLTVSIEGNALNNTSHGFHILATPVNDQCTADFVMDWLGFTSWQRYLTKNYPSTR